MEPARAKTRAILDSRESTIDNRRTGGGVNALKGMLPKWFWALSLCDLPEVQELITIRFMTGGAVPGQVLKGGFDGLKIGRGSGGNVLKPGMEVLGGGFGFLEFEK